MQITRILRSLRAAGLTQADIARRTGVPQPRLSRWGAGMAPAAADDALRLSALADKLKKAGSPKKRISSR